MSTYVRDLTADETAATFPLRYTVSHLAGLTLERDVTVHVEYVARPDGEPATLNVRWEPDAGPFPSFAGTLHAEPSDDACSKLSIAGQYDAPGGLAGQLFDAVIGVRIAHGTLEQLLAQFRDAIENDYKIRMQY